MISIVDLNLGGRSTNALTSSDWTLSGSEAQNLWLGLSGTLSANVNVITPAGQGAMYFVDNATSGAYTVTVKMSGGTGVVVPQGGRSVVFINPDTGVAYLGSMPSVMTTQGDIPYQGAGGAARLGAGTSGQFLKTQGASANPVWADLPSSVSIPVGSLLPYAGASAPSGWLLCYGQAISRSTYATLFGVTGTTYGSGDGSTTFNLPDLRGRVAAGKDNMGGSAANRITSSGQAAIDGSTLGAAGGAQDNTLDTTRIPSHTHTQDAHTHTQDAHTHTQNAHSHTVQLNTSGGGSGILTSTATNAAGTINTGSTTATNQNTTATNQSTTATNQNTGGGGAHNNLQPLQILNYIIYTGV